MFSFIQKTYETKFTSTKELIVTHNLNNYVENIVIVAEDLTPIPSEKYTIMERTENSLKIVFSEETSGSIFITSQKLLATTNQGKQFYMTISEEGELGSILIS
jgi:hypothetical protein